MNDQLGFTLLELIAVIVLITIISVFAFPFWRGASIGLYAQAQQVANDLRFAQSLAMTKGQRYRWVKTSANSYQIQNSSGTPITLANGGTSVTFTSGIAFGTLTNLPGSLVNFDGRGTPYTDTATPGTALASNATIPVTAGGQTATITLVSGTGGVALQ